MGIVVFVQKQAWEMQGDLNTATAIRKGKRYDILFNYIYSLKLSFQSHASVVIFWAKKSEMLGNICPEKFMFRDSASFVVQSLL